MSLYDARGRQVNLGESIGHGGEATVYHVSGQQNRLAKVYEPEPRPNYIYKLSWMVSHPPVNPTDEYNHPSLAWPDGLLYDARKRLKGYSMPFIEHAVPLLEVFNPRRRSIVLPQFNRRYLHRTAHNLAAAFSALHQSGYVAGDVNESNVLVTPSSLITLIDTDSFQVREDRSGNEIIYHCPVGKPEYTPPELQGKPLSEITRLPEHDAFGLAVLIFQLLMEGSHPFRSQWLGSSDPLPIEAKIARGLYPYGEKSQDLVAPPRNAVSIDTLYPPLVELFRQCFINGHRRSRWRPRPDVWAGILSDAEKALICCAEGHFYSSHLPECPYCALAEKQVSARSGQPVRGTAGYRPYRPGGQPAANPAAGNNPPAGTAASAPARRAAASRYPRAGLRWSTRATPAPAAAPAAPPPGPASASSSPSFRVLRGWMTFGGPMPNAATGAGSVPGTISAPFPGVLQGWASTRRGMLKQWMLERVRKSLLVGGMQGALAGALPGLVIGWMNWTAATPLDWALVLALGGMAAGLLRGWAPGYRLAEVIENSLGWQRFWKIAGAVSGTIGGFILGLLLFWTMVPLLTISLGMIFGFLVGSQLGDVIWRVGSKVGWQRIWGGVSALGLAGIGWGISRMVAPVGLNQLGIQLTGALMPFAANQSASWALLWAVAGATGGALVGSVVGFFVDLAGRLSRLVN